MTKRTPDQPALPGTGTPGKLVPRMRRSVDQTIRTLTATGVIDTRADAALIGDARTLADLMDRELSRPDPKSGTIGYLSAQLVPVVNMLRTGRPEQAGEGDAFAEFLQDIHTPTIRDTPQP